MYELIRTGEQSYYIDCPAKIGVYVTGDGAYLIDAGGDKDAGRRARKILDGQGWKLLGILVTHSNADHIGGCQYLQRQTGCRVFAPGIEAQFTRTPILEPGFLYGGFPPAALRHKFLLAAPCECEDAASPAFPQEVKVLPLPGHFFDMVGFRTPDDVVYLADCLSSRETLEKYQIGFLYDVAAYLNTLEMVKTLTARAFVPAPAAATEDIAPLAQYNIDKVLEIADIITELCQKPQTFEAVLQQLFRRFDLVMNFEQYVLVGSTVRSYLAWLKDSGRLRAVFDDNRLLWQQA